MEPRPARLSASSELCISCGLCCSGVIYDSVPLREDERARAEELDMHPYEDPPGQARFDLPCRHLSGTRCSVYNRRPGPCAAFRCELLKKFEAGQVSANEALGRIAEAKTMLDQLYPLVVTSGGPITPKRWGSLLDAWRSKAAAGTATSAEAQVVLELARLNRFLDVHFRSSDQQVVKQEE
jgi:Fe-S-cluster containining protein